MDHTCFRDFINRHEWTFAKTYAAFCPHEYIVRKKLPEEEQSLFPEIAGFIREKGFVAEYGRLGPNWYYVVDEYYYWTLDKDVEDTDLINRAKLSDFEFVEKEGKLICRWKGWGEQTIGKKPKQYPSLIERWLEDEDPFGTVDGEPIPDDDEQ